MSEPTTQKKVYIKTMGCQMNVYDTGKILAQLASDGYEETDSADGADLILLNTCSIREKAVDKMHSALGRYRLMKKKNRNIKIGIVGCVAQERGEELLRKYHDVDIIFGPDGVPHVNALVKQAQLGERVLDTQFLDLDGYPFVSDVDPREHGVGAFVTIQKGCDNKCTFCIVPSTRGAEVSRPHEEIVDEVEKLVAKGVQDITLIGQNVNSYGLKHEGEITFAQLLYKVAAVPGVRRIRYTTSHPRDMGDDVIEAYRDLPQLTSHLHLPVQSGSNLMLRRMKRYYTREHFLEVIRKLRDARPDLVLTTDIIVGFPQESEEDFQATLSLLDDANIISAFSFKYSPRPGTPALKIKGHISNEVASERLTRFQEKQRALSLAFHRSLEGEVVEVLVEAVSRHDEGAICGRTSGNVMVNFPGSKSLIGTFVNVRITRGLTNTCRGEQHEG